MQIPEHRRQLVDEVARRYGTKLRRYLMSRLGPRRAAADDLVQEVYLRLLKIDPKTEVRDPEAVMMTIAKRVAIANFWETSKDNDHVISGPTEGLEMQEVQPMNALQNDLMEQVLHRKELITALLRRPRRGARILLMHKHRGMTLEEIGQRLKITRKSAENQYLAAKARLAAALGAKS